MSQALEKEKNHLQCVGLSQCSFRRNPSHHFPPRATGPQSRALASPPTPLKSRLPPPFSLYRSPYPLLPALPLLPLSITSPFSSVMAPPWLSLPSSSSCGPTSHPFTPLTGGVVPQKSFHPFTPLTGDAPILMAWLSRPSSSSSGPSCSISWPSLPNTCEADAHWPGSEMRSAPPTVSDRFWRGKGKGGTEEGRGGGGIGIGRE